jgi:hypothetical protein
MIRPDNEPRQRTPTTNPDNQPQGLTSVSDPDVLRYSTEI